MNLSYEFLWKCLISQSVMEKPIRKLMNTKTTAYSNYTDKQNIPC